jgi:hypothetical protein
MLEEIAANLFPFLIFGFVIATRLYAWTKKKAINQVNTTPYANLDLADAVLNETNTSQKPDPGWPQPQNTINTRPTQIKATEYSEKTKTNITINPQVPDIKKPTNQVLKLTKHNLLQGIILKEILSKPKALR